MRQRRKFGVLCPNETCRCYNKPDLKNIIRSGKQKNGTQRYQCTECKRTFARTLNTPFFRKHLTRKQIIPICKMLAEKTSYRAIARITGHHLDTVRGVADTVGQHCERFNEYFVQELKLDPIEVDEMWSFIKKKKSTATRVSAKRAKSATHTPISA